VRATNAQTPTGRSQHRGPARRPLATASIDWTSGELPRFPSASVPIITLDTNMRSP